MDRDLVEQARRGDREAFAVLVHQVSDSLYAVAQFRFSLWTRLFGLPQTPVRSWRTSRGPLPHDHGMGPSLFGRFMSLRAGRKVGTLVAIAAILAALTAGTVLGSLVNGSLPATGFIHTSVMDNSVSIANSDAMAGDIAALQRYINDLSSIKNPTTAQRVALATYTARLTDYQARYAAAIDLRASRSINVKTTYSRVPPNATYEAGWHVHNGPVIVTVTVGTLTLVDSECAYVDVKAGHTYIESPGQVLNAKALPAKNSGIANVEWFTTRLYPNGAIDPVPVAAPCTP